MTELAAGGSSAERPTGYINGKGTLDPRLRRRATGSHTRASDRVPTPATDVSPMAPAAQLGTWQLAHYRCALETAGHLQDIWRDGVSALAREGIAQLQEAGEQAMAVGQAMADAAPEQRTDLAWDYMRSTLERMLANSATVLDLLVRPTHQALDLLAASSEASGTPAATKRAA
ncbi:MAG: hypothetical protein WAS21_08810 [Geminicoccaceae bacterium]